MESRIEILISCSPGTKRARQVLEIDIPAQINLMCLLLPTGHLPSETSHSESTRGQRYDGRT